MFLLTLAMLMLSASQPSDWQHVGTVLPFATVYIDPALANPSSGNQTRLTVIAQRVKQEVRVEGALLVDFFNNRTVTPTAVPYSAEARAHWAARVVFAHDGAVEFIWWPDKARKK